MKDTIKQRFYRIDFKVECDGDIHHYPYVEYAKTKEILEALIYRDIREITSEDDCRVISYVVESADNEDIREFLYNDRVIAHQVLVEMLDIAF